MTRRRHMSRMALLLGALLGLAASGTPQTDDRAEESRRLREIKAEVDAQVQREVRELHERHNPWGLTAEQSARGIDALLEALVDRARAAPAQRPFRPNDLQVSSGPSAEAEVVGVVHDLRNAIGDLRRGARWACWERSEALASRVAFLPWLVGGTGPSLPGWEAVRDEALRFLEELKQPSKSLPAHRLLEELGQASTMLPMTDSNAALFKTLLLDLAGRTREAEEALADLKVRHFCGNCAMARTAVIDERRSETAELRGERAEALRLLLKSFDGSSLRHPQLPLDDIILARLGLLLLSEGRAEEGVAVLQCLLDLQPDAVAAPVARAALEQVGAFLDPTSERLRRVYVDGSWPETWRALALQALAAGDGADSLAELEARWRRDEAGALEALSGLDDARVIPLLREALETCDMQDMHVVLTGLAMRDGDGVRLQHARKALDRVAKEQDLFLDLAVLDTALRELLGDGPDLQGFDDLGREALAAAWQRWLDEGE